VKVEGEGSIVSGYVHMYSDSMMCNTQAVDIIYRSNLLK